MTNEWKICLDKNTTNYLKSPSIHRLITDIKAESQYIQNIINDYYDNEKMIKTKEIKKAKKEKETKESKEEKKDRKEKEAT
mgnify:CR=1 FL=1